MPDSIARIVVTCTAIVVLGLAQPAAQTAAASAPGLEGFVTVGWGRTWRFGDETRFGSGPNVGGGLVLRNSSGWAAALSADRTFGSPLGPTVFAASVRYYFRSAEPVQPYLSGGIGVLLTKTTNLPPTERSGLRATDVGYGPNVGAGVRIAAGTHWSAHVDAHWIDALWRSPLNISVTRVSAGAGFSK
jgi:opacity protein-like surface antigen